MDRRGVEVRVEVVVRVRAFLVGLGLRIAASSSLTAPSEEVSVCIEKGFWLRELGLELRFRWGFGLILAWSPLWVSQGQPQPNRTILPAPRPLTAWQRPRVGVRVGFGVGIEVFVQV